MLPTQPSQSSDSTTPSLRYTWGVALGLCAGWAAAGSCGVLASSLQSLLIWSLLIAATILVQPRCAWRGMAVAGAILAVVLITSRALGTSSTESPLAVVVVLGLLAACKRGMERHFLQVAGLAVLALALFRFAQQQIPMVWLLSDWLGGQLSHITAAATGQGVRLGATFAGIDFLVTMTVFWLGMVAMMRAPRLTFALFATVCILFAQTVYLVTLALTHQITDLLPPAAIPLFDNPYIPPEFCWSTIARQMLPWNLPALGALLQTVVVVLIMRWTPWRTPEHAATASLESTGPASARPASAHPASAHPASTDIVQPVSRRGIALAAAPIILALLIPLLGVLNSSPSRLDGKRIIANEQDDIDYLVAEHDVYGQQSAGMFGLLPTFVRSLGGELQTVLQCTSQQLDDADLLLLLHPNQTWLQQNEPIWEYVRGGGSLLIVTDGFDPEFGQDVATSELLAPTSIVISQDAATSVTGDWQEALLASFHGATTTVNAPATKPFAGHFFSDHGASLQIG